MTHEHIPVLLKETIAGLALQPGMRVVDCTLGLGGHSEAILQKIGKTGALLAIDEDARAIALVQERLAKYDTQVQYEHGNFAHLADIVRAHNFSPFDAIVFDLGISSFQLDDPARGFSFLAEGPLDMRTNASSKLTAEHIVNTWDTEEITRILKQYSDERFAKSIARKIVKSRELEPIKTTTQLAAIVKRAIPKRYWPKNRHVATRTFMALRIEVNNEIENLRTALTQAVAHLKPGGRIAVISFHSIEDRIVKQAFRTMATGCVCPLEMPICQCTHQPEVTIITKKPINASDEEQAQNPRSRSAHLRIAERT